MKSYKDLGYSIKLKFILIFISFLFLCGCKEVNTTSSESKTDTLPNTNTNSRTVFSSKEDDLDSNFAIGVTLSSEIVNKHLLKSINEKKIGKNKSLSILGKMKQQPSIELKNYILLANASNTIIDRTALTKEGSFKFEKLQQGSYNILIQKPVKGLDIEVETQFVDETAIIEPETSNKEQELVINKILSPVFIQKHLLFPLPSEQVRLKQGNIDGIITAKETVPIDNVEIFLVDSDGKVLSKTITSASGKFSFKKLPTGSYNLVIGQTNLNYSAKLLDTKDDTSLPETINPLVNETLPNSYIQKNKVALINHDLFRDDFCNLKGKMNSATSSTVVITDMSNKVLRITKANSTGSFLFEKLPYGDYILLVDNKPNGIKVDFSVDADETQLIQDNAQVFNFEINSKVPKIIIERNGLGEMEVGNIKNVHGFFHENLAKQKKPIPNEHIYIVDSQDKIIAKTVSDNNGKFSFSKLNSGKYTIIGNRNYSKMNIGLDLSFKQNGLVDENQY